MKSLEALDLLLPKADAGELARARDVARFLRLLLDDARRAAAPTVGVSLERARRTLERSEEGASARALEDLLRHLLRAIAPADSWCAFGEPALSWKDAWRALDEAGTACALELPQPGEPPAESARRVLEARERAAHSAGGAGSSAATAGELWRGRWTHASAGARAAEPLFRALGARAARARAAPWIARSALAGLAECLLERGAVRDARALLAAQPLALSADPRLRQLFGWSRALLGDFEGAEAVLSGLPGDAGPVPAALVELRELVELRGAVAAFARTFTGRPSRCTGPVECAPLASPRALERASFGASALIVFAFEPGRGARAVHSDAAPALERALAAWTAGRESAPSTGGAREQHVVARAAVHVEHAAAERALPGCLGGAATRAVALAPILDAAGEVGGWLHLEFEHHGAPSRARLAAVACALGCSPKDGPGHGTGHALASTPDGRTWSGAQAPADPRTSERAPAARPALAAAFAEAVAALGVKTAQRLWRGYVLEGGAPLFAVEGGEGQGFPPAVPGGRRALDRALATGARIDFEEPDERLALHAGAASGVVLPIALDGRAVALLAIESSRRRDFRGLAPDACARWGAAAAVALAAAAFRDEHSERHGFEPWLPVARQDFQGFALRLVQAARSAGLALFEGPAGVGKLVLARWLHRESQAAGGPFAVHSCGAPPPRGGLAALLERARGGTLVLDDVERLDSALQDELLRALEGTHLRPAACRLAATTRVPLAESARSGALRADLAARLDRLRLWVPGLAARREEIPGFAQAAAGRFARELGRTPVRFDDEALAALWRQAWPGNLRELENVVFKLALAAPGAEVGALDLDRVAREFGFELARRLPSRHPSRDDLLAALATTATSGGRANKSRAALYLGWDPDTLVARLAERGIGEELGEVAAWGRSPQPTPPARIAVERSGSGSEPEPGRADVVPHEVQGEAPGEAPGEGGDCGAA